MKIFISYGTASDQIVALRLQTLAAVYGLTIYVPPATTRQTPNPAISAEVQQKLQESDVVLAVMMHSPAASAVSEMNWAFATGKLLIPIVSPFVPHEYYAQFQPHFVVNPSDPSQTEGAIVRFLADKQQAEQTKTALLALATLALALFLFPSDTK
jgi:hypothetical protein